MAHLSHSWLPYLYQYGLGAIIFIVGLVITLKSGSFDPRQRVHRRWLSILVVGFIWFVTFHGALTAAALGHELLAVVAALVVMTLSILGAVLLGKKHRQRQREQERNKA